MKKRLLIISVLLFSTINLKAQCTITPSCTPSTTSGYCTNPLSGSSLPSAMVGASYNSAIQVSVSTTALGGSVQILGVIINSATLPAGLSYTTNPPGGSISGGSNACIEITGTPTTEWLAFNVSFDVTAMTDQGNVNQTLNYTMDVNASTASLSELGNASMVLFPNPAENKITLTVNEPTNIKIVNVIGTIVLTDSIQSNKTINVSEFKNGVYFVVNESTGTSIKMIKN